jgi:flagellar basal-body rod protein FlgB
MPNAFDAMFGIHAEALALRSRRLELIASNIANADTPGYKARDLDFKAALSAALAQAQPGTPQASHAQHLPGIAAPAGAPGDPTFFRTPLQPSVDGNTVDAQQEHAAFAQAALEYQATLMFAERRARSLLSAITGE